MKRVLLASALFAAGVALVGSGACGDTIPATMEPGEGPGGAPAGGGAVEPEPTPSPDVAEDPEVPVVPGRAVHRLTVEQLARSIPIVTGGIEWTEDFGQGEQDMLEILSGTLGAPDYVLVTSENLEPSLIIAKFMQDAAVRVCAKWVARDRDLAPAERTLVVHESWASQDEEDVKSSIRALQLDRKSVV